MIYTSATLSLAALEYLVHVDPEDVPADLLALQIHVPDDVPTDRVASSDLPPDWNEVLDHPACATRGNSWAQEARTPILRVPSAIVPEEENILINPRHTDAGLIRVVHTRDFAFDPRLLT